jgi:DNA-binding transcriptional LysR family regulator
MPSDWDELRILLALSRAGSLGAGARQLKVDPTTVARRIASLEESLGVRLVVRSPDGIKLTREGDLAVAAAGKMEEAIAGLRRKLESSGETGVVRLATTDSFAHFLLHFLPEFASSHPGLQVESISGVASLDLARGEADLAIRFFRPKQDGIVVRKIGTCGWSLYGSDAYLGRRGPVKLGALSGHDFLGYEDSLASVAGAVWMREHASDAPVVLRGNSPRALAEAVAAGLGISVIPCFIAAGNPSLRRLVPDVLGTSEIWTAVHEDLKDVPRVRAVLDFVQALVQRERALFAGEQ